MYDHQMHPTTINCNWGTCNKPDPSVVAVVLVVVVVITVLTERVDLLTEELLERRGLLSSGWCHYHC